MKIIDVIIVIDLFFDFENDRKKIYLILTNLDCQH